MLSQLTLILICMAANAFFAGIETGAISINRVRLRHHVEENEPWAVVMDAFLRNPDRLLATTLIGTNVSMIVASVEAASLGRSLLGLWGEAAFGAALTALVLVFSEYLPKAWFQSQPMERCRPFAGVLNFSEKALRPLATAITWLTNWIVAEPSGTESRRYPFITREELEVLAQEGEEHGVLSPKQRIMIHRVFQLAARTAAQVMVPKPKLAVARASDTVAEFIQAAGKSGFTRFPVFDDAQGKYVGIINLFDALSAPAAESGAKIVRFMRPPLFVRGSTALIEILPQLRLNRQPQCLVTDDRGEVVGLITSQTVVQEIVGKL